MQINPMVAIVVMLLFVVIYASYSARQLKDKIHCEFRRQDRTKIVRWAKQTQSRIEFDGGWYDVIPSATTLRLWDSGIHLFFPVWVRCSDYRFDSSKPLNPDTFDNQYSPEQRKQLDRTDDIRALEQGNQKALTPNMGKQGALQRYLPVIILVGFAILGWMMWQQQGRIDKVGIGQNYIEAQIGQMQKSLPALK